MNRHGNHLGRPPYTPDERLEASQKQFVRGLWKNDGGHWYNYQDHFVLPNGKRVRKQQFSYRLAHPNERFYDGDKVIVTCEDKHCINPEHLAHVLGPNAPGATGVGAGAPKGSAVVEQALLSADLEKREKQLVYMMSYTEDAELLERQQAALDQVRAELAAAK